MNSNGFRWIPFNSNESQYKNRISSHRQPQNDDFFSAALRAAEYLVIVSPRMSIFLGGAPRRRVSSHRQPQNDFFSAALRAAAYLVIVSPRMKRVCVGRNWKSWAPFAESATEGRLCVERSGKSWAPFAESATEGRRCVERNGKYWIPMNPNGFPWILMNSNEF